MSQFRIDGKHGRIQLSQRMLHLLNATRLRERGIFQHFEVGRGDGYCVNEVLEFRLKEFLIRSLNLQSLRLCFDVSNIFGQRLTK